MHYQSLVEQYLTGVELLRTAIAGMSTEQLAAAPIPGTWSTQQVVCHLADFEPVYADRIKRIIAEESPQLASGDPDLFASRLCYEHRDVQVELDLITAVRKQLAAILSVQPDSAFTRIGIHSVEGPLTLETYLKRITGHIPHHVKFIHEKRSALGLR